MLASRGGGRALAPHRAGQLPRPCWHQPGCQEPAYPWEITTLWGHPAGMQLSAARQVSQLAPLCYAENLMNLFSENAF